MKKTIIFLLFITYLMQFSFSQDKKIEYIVHNQDTVIIKECIYNLSTKEKNEISIKKYAKNSSNNSFILDDNVEIFIDPELKAEYVGGKRALISYLNKYFKETHIGENFVYVSFVVSDHGNINNKFIEYSNNFVDACYAIHILEEMPNWIPAKINGKPVNSLVVLKIQFSYLLLE